MTDLVRGRFDRGARCIPEHQGSAVGHERFHFKTNIAVNDDSFVIIYSLYACGNAPCRISPDTIFSDRLTDTFIPDRCNAIANIRWAPRDHAMKNRSLVLIVTINLRKLAIPDHRGLLLIAMSYVCRKRHWSHTTFRLCANRVGT
jgi:hypothetical protein